jgi:hypothetical protein
MVTLVIMSIIVGDIPIVVIYLKKMFGFYKKKPWNLENKKMFIAIKNNCEFNDKE